MHNLHCISIEWLQFLIVNLVVAVWWVISSCKLCSFIMLTLTSTYVIASSILMLLSSPLIFSHCMSLTFNKLLIIYFIIWLENVESIWYLRGALFCRTHIREYEINCYLRKENVSFNWISVSLIWWVYWEPHLTLVKTIVGRSHWWHI